jgi:hypothetical protein
MRDELGYRLHQQAILAQLGLAALKGGTLDKLLQDAVLLTAEGVQGRFCKVLEYDAHSHRFLVREGVGWNRASLVSPPSAPIWSLRPAMRSAPASQ